MNILLARWLPMESYGAFSISFAGFLFLSGFHNVLLLEPMSVIGPAAYAKRLNHYVGSQVLVHVALLGPIVLLALPIFVLVMIFASSSLLLSTIVGAGLAAPFLLLLWLARRCCYVLQRSDLALLGASINLAVVCVGVGVAHVFGWLTPSNAFLLMGFSSLSTAVFLLRRLGVAQGLVRHALRQFPTSVRENWNYGRWLMGTAILYPLSNQFQAVLLASTHGLEAAGALRAVSLPAMVLTQTITATSMFLLPNFSRKYGEAGAEGLQSRAYWASGLLGFSAVTYTVVLFNFAVPIEQLLYHGKYASHAVLIPLISLGAVFTAFSSGLSMSLRASRRPQFDLSGNFLAALVGLVSAFMLVPAYGVFGAATSVVLSFLAYGVVVVFIYSRKRAESAYETARDRSEE